MAEVFRHRAGGALSLSEVLSAVDKWRHAPPPEEPEVAIEELEAGLRLVEGQDDAFFRQVRLSLRMVLGNLCRDTGDPNRALGHYDAGVAEVASLDLSSDAVRNEVANLRTNRAICRMGAGQWGDALPDLDEAIRLREQLPLESEPVYRWGLAAGWVNRGDALRALEKPEEAVVSYDRGLCVLGEMEATDPVRGRSAVAWNNRGLVLEGMGRRDEARESFRRAVDLVEGLAEEGAIVTGAAARLHGCRLSPDGGGDEAAKVLESVAEWERKNPMAAEVGLKARHWIAKCLSERVRGDEWILETTDLVDEGLELERAWEAAGVMTMRAVACDLFRLGLRVYRVCQPQFLAEFVIESIDPEVSPGAPSEDAAFQAAAVEALAIALRESMERGVSEDRAEKELAITRSLREADRRLAELQQA